MAFNNKNSLSELTLSDWVDLILIFLAVCACLALAGSHFYNPPEI